MLWLCVNNHYYLVRWTLNPKHNTYITWDLAETECHELQVSLHTEEL